MGNSWDESRSDRHDRAGFEGRQARLATKIQPTDQRASARLPVEFAARLTRAVGSAIRTLTKDQPDEGWGELLTVRRAWSLSLLLAFWYLLRSNRDGSSLPAIRALTTDSPAGFYSIFRFFDTKQEVLERPAQLAYDASKPEDATDAADAFRYAAAQIGASLLRTAVGSSFFVVASDLLNQQVPPPLSLLGVRDEDGELPRLASDVPAPGTARPAGRAEKSLPIQSGDAQDRSEARPQMSLPNTQLQTRDHCMTLLLSKGLSVDEAEQICAGPSRRRQSGLQMAFDQARSAGRPLFVMVGATWCGPCNSFKKLSGEVPILAAELERFLFVEVDTDVSANAKAVGEELQVTAYPTFIVMNSDGTEQGRLVGFRDPEEFSAWLRKFSFPKTAET